jgi:hypothetical protein
MSMNTMSSFTGLHDADVELVVCGTVSDRDLEAVVGIRLGVEGVEESLDRAGLVVRRDRDGDGRQPAVTHATARSP